MDPVRAHEFGVDPEEVQITCSQKHSGKWIVWVPDPGRGQYILTEGHDIFAMCWWRAQLRILANGS